MVVFSGHTAIAAVREEGDLVLHRVNPVPEGWPVLLKAPACPCLSPALRSQLEHENDLARVVFSCQSIEEELR
jgi:hypothetical protein